MEKLMSKENSTTLTEERVREIVKEEIEKWMIENRGHGMISPKMVGFRSRKIIHSI